MKTTIALAAATVIAMGAGSAYAQGGNVHPGIQVTESPSASANPQRSLESAPTNNDNMGHAVSFMALGGQVSFPPGYKPYYDRADHVVTLRYAQPIATSNQSAGHTVSFMAMGGQVAFPPGYKPYYDRAGHVVVLRYTGPVVAEIPTGHTVSFMAMGGQVSFPPGYKPYYDHADHVVILRYAHGASTDSTHG